MSTNEQRLYSFSIYLKFTEHVLESLNYFYVQKAAAANDMEATNIYCTAIFLLLLNRGSSREEHVAIKDKSKLKHDNILNGAN